MLSFPRNIKKTHFPTYFNPHFLILVDTHFLEVQTLNEKVDYFGVCMLMLNSLAISLKDITINDRLILMYCTL